MAGPDASLAAPIVAAARVKSAVSSSVSVPLGLLCTDSSLTEEALPVGASPPAPHSFT